MKKILSCCCFELRRLIGNRESIDDICEVSRHDHGEIREVLIDPMIRHAILREVIGADLLTTVSCPDLGKTISSLCLCFLLLFEREESSPQYGYRLHFILQLGSLILTLDSESRWEMDDTDSRVRLVHVLPSCTTRSTCEDLEVLFSDLDIDIFDFGHDSHGRRRCMNTTIFLCTRYSLDTVDT